VWQRVQPDGVTGRDLWVWKDCGLNDPEQIGYGRVLEDLPTRLVKWTAKGAMLDTPAHFATLLYTNRSYPFGFWNDPLRPQDVYLRLPGDVDPNTLTLSLGSGSAFTINGPDVVIEGGQLRTTTAGVLLFPQAMRARLGGITTIACRMGVWIRGEKPNVYGADHVIDGCTFLDSETWRDDGRGIPWHLVKYEPILSDGTKYGWNRIGDMSESCGVNQDGGALNVTIANCTIDGPFNGVCSYNVGFDQYATQGLTIRDCLIRHCADDALEPEQTAIGHRYERVRAEWCATFLSTAPTANGPIDVVDCTAWQIGAPPNAIGPAANGPFVKYGGGSFPTAEVRLTRCTFWTDLPGVDGGDKAGGGDTRTPRFVIRDSLVRTTRSAFTTPGGVLWSEDGNHFATTDTTRGLVVAGQRFTRDVAGYRSLTGQGKTTNLGAAFVDAAWLDAQMEDPANGNLAVKSGSPLAGKGAAP
jgi:hypothetical protein